MAVFCLSPAFEPLRQIAAYPRKSPFSRHATYRQPLPDNIMTFDIDKQTIRDLEIFPEKKNAKSIYNFYKRTETKGGQESLHEMINVPVSDLEFLQPRKDSISFFINHDCLLKLHSRQIDYVEFYLRNRRFPLRDNIIDATFNGISNKLSPDSDYYIISEGVFHILQLT